MLKNELFGRSAEKRHEPHPDQRLLFDGDDNGDTDPSPTDDETIEIAAHSRKKRGRRALPKDLPRIDIIHDIDEEQKQCGCGQLKSCIGEEVSEKLDYIPAQLRVERHIRLKYACKSCEGVEDDAPTVMIAPAPVQLIPKSNATAGLLRTLPYPSLPTGCRCTVKRKYLIVWALSLRGQRWPNGWFRPPAAVWD